jgi:hypothetical protein
MEWVLQVVDELDDAVGTVRHYVLGFSGEFSLMIAGSAAAGAVYAALLQVTG